MIFITLMLPVEVRIIPTYAVVANFGMIDTFAGLTIMRFLWSVLLPLSRTNVIAMQRWFVKGLVDAEK